MSRQFKRSWSWFLVACLTLAGCHPIQPNYINEDGDLSHYLDAATEIEEPDLDLDRLAEVEQASEPLTVTNTQFDEIWELSLEDAIATALQNSKVVRQIRARAGVFQTSSALAPEALTINAGQGVPTVYDPALQATSQNGVEQTLSAFDAQLSTNLFWDRTDRPQDVFGSPLFQRDLVTSQTELSKRSATGSQFFMRSETRYDNTPTVEGVPVRRPLTISWFHSLEAEVRQPLLRGRGTQVNRIPVVIARIQQDIALHDFEANVRNLASDVESAYWALYFAYRNLDATRIGRNSALATWKRIYALYVVGAPGGEAENEAQSREQYFFFRARLQDALNRLYSTEKQLRYLMGLTPTDGRIIRPADEPTTAKVEFEWGQILSEGMIRSPELRRQKWLIKQRELELIALRNQLLPQLDFVGIYRFLGMGDKLYGGNPPGASFPDQDTSAWDELLDGRYQEGRLGLQFTMPLGFRRELTQVRNRQLQLARDKAVLKEMELEVTHQLTSAIQELKLQFAVSQTNLNRIRAAVHEVNAIQEAYTAGSATLDRLLDAQRRRSDAEVAFAQSLTDYNLAIMRVHYRKGSLLEYDGIVLAEGPWPAKAYFDAHRLARRRDASYYLDYGHSRPKVISRGPVAQQVGSPIAAGESAMMTGPSGDASLEPIPAPEPEPIRPQPSTVPAEPSADPLPTSDLDSAGPVLSAPRAPAPEPNRPSRVQKASYGVSQFQWGKLSLDDSSAPSAASKGQSEPPKSSRAVTGTKTVDDAVQGRNVKQVSHLKWKVKD